jgi:hypothetical protein
MSNTTTLLAWAALLVFGCALFALGAQWPAFSHAQHPVAFAGMRGVEGAWLFNAMVFVRPGAMLSLVALRLRRALATAGWGDPVAVVGACVRCPRHVATGS